MKEILRLHITSWRHWGVAKNKKMHTAQFTCRRRTTQWVFNVTHCVVLILHVICAVCIFLFLADTVGFMQRQMLGTHTDLDCQQCQSSRRATQ